MTDFTRLAIIRHNHKDFPQVLDILLEYFKSRGELIQTSDARGDVLHFLIKLDPKKRSGKHKPTKSAKSIYSQILGISLCKHGFFIIKTKTESKHITLDEKESFQDISSELEFEMNNNISLIETYQSNVQLSLIPLETGIIYVNTDMRKMLEEHMLKVEERYSNMLLRELYAPFMRSNHKIHKQGFIKRFRKIYKEINTYSNKLHNSNCTCKLFKTDKKYITASIEFLDKLCIHLEEIFDRFALTEPLQEEIEEKFRGDIKKLLKNEESFYIEYKSTLKYDLKTRQPNKKLVDEVVREIVAFMNSYTGGIVIVGYNDDEKKIIGIEKDFSHVGKKNNWDDWSLLLNNVCGYQIGQSAIAKYVIVEKVNYDNHTLAKILVKPANNAQYILKKDFHIRINNQTKKLEGKDLEDYINERFV